MNDVVTDWSYALAGFLVSTLFGVSPGHFYPDINITCTSAITTASTLLLLILPIDLVDLYLIN